MTLVSLHAPLWMNGKPPMSPEDLCDPLTFPPHLGLKIETEGCAEPRTSPGSFFLIKYFPGLKSESWGGGGGGRGMDSLVLVCQDLKS